MLFHRAQFGHEQDNTKNAEESEAPSVSRLSACTYGVVVVTRSPTAATAATTNLPSVPVISVRPEKENGGQQKEEKEKASVSHPRILSRYFFFPLGSVGVFALLYMLTFFLPFFSFSISLSIALPRDKLHLSSSFKRLSTSWAAWVAWASCH